MDKWKLLLTTIPFALGVLALALLRAVVMPAGLFDFSDATPIITGATLIIGFMLAGVMADFKESEKLPGEITGALQALEDRITSNASKLKESELDNLRQKHIALVGAILDWLSNRAGIDPCYQLMRELVASSIGFDLVNYTDVLRRQVIRVDTIRRTSFIQSGYTLQDLLVASTIIILIFASYKNLFQQVVLVSLLALIYLYLARLIRDLDNPFEYSPDGKRRAAEVALFPLTDYRTRLEARNAPLAPEGKIQARRKRIAP